MTVTHIPQFNLRLRKQPVRPTKLCADNSRAWVLIFQHIFVELRLMPPGADSPTWLLLMQHTLRGDCTSADYRRGVAVVARHIRRARHAT